MPGWRSGSGDSKQDESLPRGRRSNDDARAHVYRRRSSAHESPPSPMQGVSRPSAKEMTRNMHSAGRQDKSWQFSGSQKESRKDWRHVGSLANVYHASAKAQLLPPPQSGEPVTQMSSRNGGARSSLRNEKPKELNPDNAATKIANMYRRRYRRMYLGRIVFAERLELEDKVNIGMRRLCLFGAIFCMIVYTNSLGIPPAARREVKGLLHSALGLDEFLDVRSILDLREVLPDISRRVKQFSASGGARFETAEGLEILGERQEFTEPIVLSSLDKQMALDRPSWTLSAWVEVQEQDTATSRRRSIIRRPDANNRARNCWGWYHPAQFRHGASDYHTLYPGATDDGEETVTANTTGAPAPRALSHEMVIVNNGEMMFYRDGKLLGESVSLARDVTDCWNPDKVELGSNGLSLTALKFYPRALNPIEVQEVYQEGEPLTELATGTELPRLSDSVLHQMQGHIDATTEEIVETVTTMSDNQFVLSAVSDIVGIRAGDELDAEALAVMFPQGSGEPAPVLPIGEQGYRHLPSHEQKLWTEGGRRTSNYTTGRWEVDPWINAQYWSVFEDPVYTFWSSYNPVEYKLPDFPESDGVCISFWYRPDSLSQGHGPLLEVLKDSVSIALEQQLDWLKTCVDIVRGQAYAFVHLNGEAQIASWRYLTYFEEVSGRTRERYLLTSFVQEPEPVVWRHMAWQYNVSSGSIAFYLDGKKVYESKDSTARFRSYTLPPGTSARLLFSNATVLQRKVVDDLDNPWDDIPGKMAQLRFYSRLLSPEEMITVQDYATWDGSWNSGVKQCVEFTASDSFVDSKEKDTRGRTCSWYAKANSHYDHVCSSVQAKVQCPVTCKGRRICHDGSLNPSFSPRTPRRKYRVFDRIMWLKPRKHPGSLVCPSKSAAARQEEIIARCREIRGENPTDWTGPSAAYHNFTRIRLRNWHELDPVNLWDCEDMEARLDAEQCSWDDSWLPDFQEEFNEAGTWAISLWVRPKDGSLGMPSNFWFAVSLFSALSPPLMLNHWNEREPQLEPWMDTRTVVADPLSGPSATTSPRRPIWPTTLVDYAGSWTMLYAQVERRESDSYYFCATLNGLPPSCSWVDGGPVFEPGRFLEGLEFTTEMLVSPIEVTTEPLTRAEIQEKYYREQDRMARLAGPAYPEFERGEHLQVTRRLTPFAERVALVAPPLLFQERREVEACVSPLTIPFFLAQKKLMLAAHCRESNCPDLEDGDPDATDMIASCPGKVAREPHFGRMPTNINNLEGYTDFLYTIADNSVLVRDGEALPALSFIDTSTTYFVIIALFHVPESALTTMLELSGDMSGNAIDPEVRFRHYGYLDNASRGSMVTMYVILIALIAVTLILNVWELRILLSDSKKNQHAVSKQAVGEIVYDFLQCGIVLVYIVITFVSALQSEEVATDIVSGVATVPFYHSDKTFQEKSEEFADAIEKFNRALSWDNNVDSLAFAIMVLMLIRIIAATAVHPRTGVLTGTVMKTLNDLWHFAILFMIVFLCFGVAANLFFGEREDFADTQTALQTQFDMLLGELPEEYDTDPRIIVYVCLSILVLFLLMLNFLLAIIVDGYMQVRTDIETSEAENEFLTDVALSIYGDILSFRKGWPHKREVAFVLRDKIRSQRVCARHLIIQGFNAAIIRDMLSWYHTLDGLSIDPPFWEKKPSRYVLQDRQLLSPTGADSWQGGIPPLGSDEEDGPPADGGSVTEKLESIGRRLQQLEGMAQDVSELKAAVIMLVEEYKGEGSFFGLLSKAPGRAQLSLSPKSKDEDRERRKQRKRDRRKKGEDASEGGMGLFSAFAGGSKSKDRNSDPPPAVGFPWGQDVRKRIEQSIATFTAGANGKEKQPDEHAGPASARDPPSQAESASRGHRDSRSNGQKSARQEEGDRVCGVV